MKKVDRKSSEVLSALATDPVFKKQGRVQGRPAVEDEEVVTKLANGAEETKNTAKAGAWVMTNPSGEQYIISEQKFLARYEAVDGEPGVYQAKGHCRAVRNPFGESIEIMASWGQPQTGDENCLFADTCDAEGNNMGGEPYLIDSKAFEETYKPV